MLLFHLHSSAQPTYFIFDKASPVFILIFILHKYGHLGDGEGRELSWSVFEKLLYPQRKPQFCLKLNGRENLYFKSKTRNRGCVCKEHVKRTPLLRWFCSVENLYSSRQGIWGIWLSSLLSKLSCGINIKWPIFHNSRLLLISKKIKPILRVLIKAGVIAHTHSQHCTDTYI